MDQNPNMTHSKGTDERLDDEVGNVAPDISVGFIDLDGVESLGDLLQRLSGLPAQDGERCQTRGMTEDWEPFFSEADVRRMFYAGQIVLHTSMAASAPDSQQRAEYMDKTREYMKLWIAGDSSDSNPHIAALEACNGLFDTLKKVDALGHDMVEHGVKGVFLPPM